MIYLPYMWYNFSLKYLNALTYRPDFTNISHRFFYNALLNIFIKQKVMLKFITLFK